MRKEIIISIVIVALFVVLLFANPLQLTGNTIIPFTSEVSYKGYFCEDSDGAKGPDSIYEKSTVTMRLKIGNSIRTVEDRCSTSEKAVKEAICTQRARIQFIKRDCKDEDCVNGACIRPRQ